jgi:ABC-type cobalamin/Fe3+-siderophores transport system ATPase subunit
MISELRISNFRCYKDLKITGFKTLNIIVGDNGAGKTALLEAIFLVLNNNAEISLRMKAHRGFENQYTGTIGLIEEALWREYFNDGNWDEPIQIETRGTEPHSRKLSIVKSNEISAYSVVAGSEDQQRPSPIQFEWEGAEGNKFTARAIVAGNGIQVPAGPPVYPETFLFPANTSVSSTEVAQRFSVLSQVGDEVDFIKLFTREFPIIKGLSIEVVGGLPVVHATLSGARKKQAINSVSGGINRTLAIMLTMAISSGSVVLADEIENGLYHKHKLPVVRSLVQMTQEKRSQLFLTTHDEEWLKALVEASERELRDIALFRVERDESGYPHVVRFDGLDLEAAIEYGADVR